MSNHLSYRTLRIYLLQLKLGLVRGCSRGGGRGHIGLRREATGKPASVRHLKPREMLACEQQGDVEHGYANEPKRGRLLGDPGP